MANASRVSDRIMDATVIGGGFYGVCIASYLVRSRKLRRVSLIEREGALLGRASSNNQARIHSGYHYPRNFTTAFRSRVNFPKFLEDWPDAVNREFLNLYAIARVNSQTTTRQFLRFCRSIGAPVKPATTSHSRIFESRLIDSVFEVDEVAFDAAALHRWAEQELADCGVEVRLSTRVHSVTRAGSELVLHTSSDEPGEVRTRIALNCSYAGINQIGGALAGTRTGLRHEIAEIAFVEVPETLCGLGVTVLDGPFFSLTPFPSRGVHALSHVRYTPHLSWADKHGTDPYHRLSRYTGDSRANWMLRDAARYLPSVAAAIHVASSFEVKSTLTRSELDDGRPILFERDANTTDFYSVLGGKLDNIYDVLQELDCIQF